MSRRSLSANIASLLLLNGHSQQRHQPTETVLAQLALLIRERRKNDGTAEREEGEEQMEGGEEEGNGEEDEDGIGKDDGDGVDENDEQNAKLGVACDGAVAQQQQMLWRKVRILVELGLATDGRLVPWLFEMAKSMLDGPSAEKKVIRLIADRLQWVALRLSLCSLPPICSPRIHRIPPLINECPLLNTAFSPITFHAEAEVTSRIDVAGGWTDTPPITYQCATPSAVLNVSVKVNGRRPIRCRCALLREFSGVFYTQSTYENTRHTLHFPSAHSVFVCSSRPSINGSLLSAILIISGVAREELIGGERIRRFSMPWPGRGLYIVTNSDLPHGSGLGTSSILSAAVLAALWRLFGKSFRQSELVHAVLRVEQLHTTGGGWQDQVGGCLPGGFKLGTVCPEGERQCQWRTVPIGKELRNEMDHRLAIIYTGQTRLAKRLLEEVLISWLGRDRRILGAVQRLADDARRAEKELGEGKFPAEICCQYNELKKEFCAGAEPQKVAELKRELMSSGLADAAWIAGAGGGGFLCVWVAKGRALAELEQFLASDRRWKGMDVWRVQMEEEEPMLIRRGWTITERDFR